MKNVKSVVITIQNHVNGKKEDVVMKNKELFQDGYFSVKIKLGSKEFYVYDNRLPEVEVSKEENEVFEENSKFIVENNTIENVSEDGITLLNKDDECRVE